MQKAARRGESVEVVAAAAAVVDVDVDVYLKKKKKMMKKGREQQQLKALEHPVEQDDQEDAEWGNLI